MTMADTIAVMNSGVIEQLGAPGDLYEHPHSTFVANFLGQSNLIEGQVRGQEGTTYDVDVHGASLRASDVTATGIEGTCWIGVRPEKLTLRRPDEAGSDGLNRLAGGRVQDVSFVGVSTQYIVKMPWGQDLAAFEQNSGERALLRVGEEVDLTWMATHTFLLDHSQDAAAGAQLDGE